MQIRRRATADTITISSRLAHSKENLEKIFGKGITINYTSDNGHSFVKACEDFAYLTVLAQVESTPHNGGVCVLFGPDANLITEMLSMNSPDGTPKFSKILCKFLRTTDAKDAKRASEINPQVDSSVIALLKYAYSQNSNKVSQDFGQHLHLAFTNDEVQDFLTPTADLASSRIVSTMVAKNSLQGELITHTHQFMQLIHISNMSNGSQHLPLLHDMWLCMPETPYLDLNTRENGNLGSFNYVRDRATHGVSYDIREIKGETCIKLSPADSNSTHNWTYTENLHNYVSRTSGVSTNEITNLATEDIHHVGAYKYVIRFLTMNAAQSNILQMDEYFIPVPKKHVGWFEYYTAGQNLRATFVERGLFDRFLIAARKLPVGAVADAMRARMSTSEIVTKLMKGTKEDFVQTAAANEAAFTAALHVVTEKEEDPTWEKAWGLVYSKLEFNNVNARRWLIRNQAGEQESNLYTDRWPIYSVEECLKDTTYSRLVDAVSDRACLEKAIFTFLSSTTVGFNQAHSDGLQNFFAKTNMPLGRSHHLQVLIPAGYDGITLKAANLAQEWILNHGLIHRFDNFRDYDACQALGFKIFSRGNTQHVRWQCISALTVVKLVRELFDSVRDQLLVAPVAVPPVVQFATRGGIYPVPGNPNNRCGKNTYFEDAAIEIARQNGVGASYVGCGAAGTRFVARANAVIRADQEICLVDTNLIRNDPRVTYFQSADHFYEREEPGADAGVQVLEQPYYFDPKRLARFPQKLTIRRIYTMEQRRFIERTANGLAPMLAARGLDDLHWDNGDFNINFQEQLDHIENFTPTELAIVNELGLMEPSAFRETNGPAEPYRYTTPFGTACKFTVGEKSFCLSAVDSDLFRVAMYFEYACENGNASYVNLDGLVELGESPAILALCPAGTTNPFRICPRLTQPAAIGASIVYDDAYVPGAPADDRGDIFKINAAMSGITHISLPDGWKLYRAPGIAGEFRVSKFDLHLPFECDQLVMHNGQIDLFRSADESTKLRCYCSNTVSCHFCSALRRVQPHNLHHFRYRNGDLKYNDRNEVGRNFISCRPNQPSQDARVINLNQPNLKQMILSHYHKNKGRAIPGSFFERLENHQFIDDPLTTLYEKGLLTTIGGVAGCCKTTIIAKEWKNAFYVAPYKRVVEQVGNARLFTKAYTFETGLMYLDPRYRKLVIDEAQAFGPLIYYYLDFAARNDIEVLILGDACQLEFAGLRDVKGDEALLLKEVMPLYAAAHIFRYTQWHSSVTFRYGEKVCRLIRKVMSAPISSIHNETDVRTVVARDAYSVVEALTGFQGLIITMTQDMKAFLIAKKFENVITAAESGGCSDPKIAVVNVAHTSALPTVEMVGNRLLNRHVYTALSRVQEDLLFITNHLDNDDTFITPIETPLPPTRVRNIENRYNGEITVNFMTGVGLQMNQRCTNEVATVAATQDKRQAKALLKRYAKELLPGTYQLPVELAKLVGGIPSAPKPEYLGEDAYYVAHNKVAVRGEASVIPDDMLEKSIFGVELFIYGNSMKRWRTEMLDTMQLEQDFSTGQFHREHLDLMEKIVSMLYEVVPVNQVNGPVYDIEKRLQKFTGNLRVRLFDVNFKNDRTIRTFNQETTSVKYQFSSHGEILAIALERYNESKVVKALAGKTLTEFYPVATANFVEYFEARQLNYTEIVDESYAEFCLAQGKKGALLRSGDIARLLTPIEVTMSAKVQTKMPDAYKDGWLLSNKVGQPVQVPESAKLHFYGVYSRSFAKIMSQLFKQNDTQFYDMIGAGADANDLHMKFGRFIGEHTHGADLSECDTTHHKSFSQIIGKILRTKAVGLSELYITTIERMIYEALDGFTYRDQIGAFKGFGTTLPSGHWLTFVLTTLWTLYNMEVYAVSKGTTITQGVAGGDDSLFNCTFHNTENHRNELGIELKVSFEPHATIFCHQVFTREGAFLDPARLLAKFLAKDHKTTKQIDDSKAALFILMRPYQDVVRRSHMVKALGTRLGYTPELVNVLCDLTFRFCNTPSHLLNRLTQQHKLTQCIL